MTRNQPPLAWLLLFLLALIWGSSFILIKKGLLAFPGDQAASIRLFVSCIFISPFAWKYIRIIPKSKILFCILVGIFGSGTPAFLFSYAQTNLSSSMAGILNTLTPVFTLVLGILLFQLSANIYKKAGIALGFAGAIMLVYNGSEIKGTLSMYAVLVVLATMCYAISVNIMHKYLKGLNPISIAALALLFVGPPAGIYLFFTDFPDRLIFHPDAMKSFGSLVILALFSTTIATVLFNRLVQMTGAIFSSAITYLIPVVALFWGFADGEVLQVIDLLGLLAILGGVYLTNKKTQSVTAS